MCTATDCVAPTVKLCELQLKVFLFPAIREITNSPVVLAATVVLVVVEVDVVEVDVVVAADKVDVVDVAVATEVVEIPNGVDVVVVTAELAVVLVAAAGPMEIAVPAVTVVANVFSADAPVVPDEPAAMVTGPARA